LTSYTFGTGEIQIQGRAGEWTSLKAAIEAPSGFARCGDFRDTTWTPEGGVITATGSFEPKTLADWVALDNLFGGPPARPPTGVVGRPDTYRRDLALGVSRIAILEAARLVYFYGRDGL